MSGNREDRWVAGPHCEAENGSRTSHQLALFGIKSSVAWVADDAFVTRQGTDLLVERWGDRRVAAILVRADSSGTMRIIWEKLNEIAIDGLLTELRHV